MAKLIVLQSKCERYWPEVGETVEYGNVIVRNNTEIVNTDYMLREFSIFYDGEEHKIFHYHFQVHYYSLFCEFIVLIKFRKNIT